MNIKTLATSVLVLGTAVFSPNLAHSNDNDNDNYSYPEYIIIGSSNYGSVGIGLDLKDKSSTSPTQYYHLGDKPKSSFRALSIKGGYTFVEDFGNFDLGAGPVLGISRLYRSSNGDNIPKNAYTELAFGLGAVVSFKFSDYIIIRPYLKYSMGYGYAISDSKEKNLSGIQSAFGVGVTFYENFFAEIGLNARRISNSSFDDYYVAGYKTNHFYWTLGIHF